MGAQLVKINVLWLGQVRGKYGIKAKLFRPLFFNIRERISSSYFTMTHLYVNLGKLEHPQEKIYNSDTEPNSQGSGNLCRSQIYYLELIFTSRSSSSSNLRSFSKTFR
jgi:hypothetical protein